VRSLKPNQAYAGFLKLGALLTGPENQNPKDANLKRRILMGAQRFRGGLQQKPTPPLVKQPLVYDPDLEGMRISSTCWAAALSSWLSAARNDDWSVDKLVERFRPFLGKNGLDLGQFNEIADALFVRMQFEEIGKADFSWDYLYDKLLQSVVYVILENANPAHALVLYAISVDNSNTQEVWVMDPLQGYRAGALSAFRERSPTFLVGVAKKI
jgi:hypothetical protein